MGKLTDAVGDFAGSQHWLLLDDHLKADAEPLLAHWCEAVGDVVSEEGMRAALHSVAHLDVSLDARRSFPDLLIAFLEYLPSTGRFPLADEWAARVARLRTDYEASFRQDGSVRGQTVRKVGTEVGRNDPCPCGSGKKYKKCCMKLLGH